MEEGHGNHWDAIDRDLDRTISELLPIAAQQGDLHGKASFDYQDEDGRFRPETAYGLVYGSRALGFFTLVISDSSDHEQRKLVASAYPLCRRGIVHEVTAVRLLPHGNGIEGVIEATTKDGKGRVWFFDPFYYRNRTAYKAGQRYKASFAALAMALKKCDQNVVEVTQGPMVQIERDRVLREDPTADVSKINKITISLEGAAFCLPMEGCPDEASYRGVAEEVDTFEVEGRQFWGIKTSLMKLESGPFTTWVYASASVLDGYRPQVGDNLEGAIWLQGFLVDES